MTTKKITMELTEGEAELVRWAVRRAHATAPAYLRSKSFVSKLDDALEAVQTATQDIPERELFHTRPGSVTAPTRSRGR